MALAKIAVGGGGGWQGIVWLKPKFIELKTSS
jgi:hypothetical protein